MPDGEYFFTAHERAPDGRLGRMLAKAYARIRNQDADDTPCETRWNDGL